MSHTTASRRPRAAAPPMNPGGGSPSVAFDEAYREHADAVLGHARRLLGDQSFAEEVTQEVFLRLWRQPDRFKPIRGSLRSFLLAECHGRSIDLMRSESARRRREERDGRQPRAVADHANDVCATAVHDQVLRLVQSLPNDERDAISLAYSYRRTYREVAAILDTPEGTVKGRIRLGLKRLRSQMEEFEIAAA